MAKARILIVEDEKLVATDIAQCLQQLGYEVVGAAASGVEALRKAVTTEPDLVLMDIKLKGCVDGVEAAEALYERMETPVVFLTAFADMETVERAKKTFPYGYVLKPFDDRSLRTAVELALHRHAAQRRPGREERRLAQALGGMQDAVILVTAQGHVALMNQSAERLTGWREKEALNKPLEAVVTLLEGSRPGVVRGLVGRVIVGDHTGRAGMDMLLRGRDGSETPVTVQASPARDEQGKLTGVTLLFRETVK